MDYKYNPGEEVFVMGQGYGTILTVVRRGGFLRYFVALDGVESEYGEAELCRV